MGYVATMFKRSDRLWPACDGSGRHYFKGRHFEAEIIVHCVRWYLRFSSSFRDLKEIMAERNLRVDHVTIWRLSFSEIRLRGLGKKELDNYDVRKTEYLPHDLVRQKTLLVIGHAHALGMGLADTVFCRRSCQRVKLSRRKSAEARRSGCAALVATIEFADLWDRDDLARLCCLDGACLGRILLQTKMRTTAMIVVHESTQVPPETLVMEYDHVVQEITPDRAD